MRVAAQIAALVATLISVSWLIHKPGFDSAAAAAAAVTALLLTFLLRKDKLAPKQVQRVSTKSFGIQAGRDVKVDNFENK